MTRPLLRPLALILFTIFLSFTARAQTHELVLVKDINTTQSGVGYVGNGTVWNGVHYFTGNDGSTGNELWRSDGTEEGTWKVKDILPPPGASPLFFGTPEVRVVASLPASLLLHVTQVQGGTTTYELWRTDGTSAGTVKVADLPYGTPAQAQTVGGQCFFLLQPSGLFIGPPLGSTWLRTDGTAAGTVVLPVNSEPIVQQVLAGGNAYVLTRTGGGFTFPPQPMNYKLRRSDGTVAGTALVKDLGISTGFALPTLTALGSKVIFDFDSGTMGAGRELWSSDGTEAGTVLLKNIAPAGGSSDPAGFAVYNGAIFFSADDGTSGRELWKSDGTEAGTVRVADIAPGATGSDPQNFTPALGGLCFTADDGTHGRELWGTDGTEAGTQLLADVVPGAVGSQPDSLHEWKGRLYFSAYPGGTTGTAVVLWVTDGTVAGTHAVTDFAPASGVNVTGSSLLAVNDSFAVVLAVLSQPAGAGVTGFEWWALTGDGTTATRIAASLPLGSNAFLIPAPSASAIGSGRVVFSVRDTAHGTEMWSTDGTLAGTRITKDINTITDSADPGWLGEANGRLLFAANDGTHGREVWSSDGTTAGTRIEADIQPGIGDSSPSYGVNFQGEVYFNASDTPGTSGLWKSNGLPGGTASAASLPTSIYQPMLPLGGSLLMPLGELWKSDGSGAGTGLLKDIAPGGDSFPAALARVGSEVFFVPYSPLATSNSTGPTNHLWKTDGTASGTMLVKDFALFTAPERSFANSPVMPLIAGSGGVYFQIITSPTSDGSPSAEVWQSDGTDAGTVIFSTGNVVNSPKAVEMLAEIGARTIFIGWDADHGSELWAKDSGTSALLRDFFLGTDNPPITVVRTEAGRVFFNVGWSNFNIPPPANVGLWVTDGTVAGTVQLSTSPALSLVESGSVLIGSTIDAFNSGTPHIFQTDGTVAGTSLITSQTNEGIGFFSAYLRASGGKIFAIATTSQYGSELFRLNAKPVLAGSVAALTGATWNQPFTFSGSALAGLTASDADSASVQLRITSLLAGTLTVNGVAVAPGTTVISAGDTITFTPPANAHGTTPIFTVRAFDGDSFSESAATVRVQITSPYEQWLEANSFPTAEAHNTALTGPTMDSDGDGVPNGVEYLLGTAPASKDFAPYTTDVATDAQNKRHPRIVLQRAHPLPQGATLIIEETANLTDWTVIATHNGTAWSGPATVTEDPPSGGSARVTVLSATELSDTAPVCFLRLRAVVP